MSPFSSTADAFNTLFGKACHDHQCGSLDAACSGYLKLLEEFPQAPVLHYNIGLVYYEQGSFQKSCDAFEKAKDLTPDDGDVLFNLALSRKKNGDIEGAIVSFCHVLHLDAESVDTLYNLAGCYRETGFHVKAVETYLQVLLYEPEHRAATNNLAYTYHLLGENEKAVVYYGKVLKYDPAHKAAKHMLTALSGTVATTTPDSYIEDVFDNYSLNYEQSLVEDLEYCVPVRLRNQLNASNWCRKFDHGLDLGCGTGLSGEAFVDLVGRFDGIDLSGKMLGLAGEKRIYHSLYKENIINFLRKSEDIFDFYIAADVFGYVGDLEEMFGLLRDKARADALFCFSTEKLEGDDYCLRDTGRFAHSIQYIERLAAATEWSLLERQDWPLRRERDAWITGCLWFFCLNPLLNRA